AEQKEKSGFSLRGAFNRVTARKVRDVALDIGARWATVGQIRMVVGAAVMGAGFSSFCGVAAAVAASAIGSAAYTYVKDYTSDVLEARRADKPWREISFFNEKRAQKAKKALLFGALGGTVGASIMAGLETEAA